MRPLRTALSPLVAILLGAGGAAAETDLGPVKVSGEVHAGYQAIGGDFGSAKFDQYRDGSPSLALSGDLLVEDGEAARFLRARFSGATNDDQAYALRFGRYGSYRIDLGLSQFSQVFSNRASSPYGGGDGARLPLPAGFAPQATAAGMNAALTAFSTNPDLGFRQRNWTSEFRAWASEAVEVRASYDRRERDGNQPWSLNFGSPGGRYVSFPAPVDDATHSWTGAASWIGDGWNLAFDYRGSSYVHEDGSVLIDNPTTTGTTLLGGPSLHPNNDAHQLSLSGSTQLDAGMPVRVSGTLSYAMRRQDESFLPMSANLAGAQPPLPASSLDGEVDTILANLLATARPSKRLNLKARYRYYDYRNGTDTLRFAAGRVRNDDGTLRTGLAAEQNDYLRQTASLEGSYRLSHETKLTAEYEWDNRFREHRETTRQNDHAVRLAVDHRPERWARFAASYELRRRDGNGYSPQGGANPLLRMFDVADRTRNRVDASMTLMPTDAFDLTASAQFDLSNFENSSYGLDREVGWQAGIDAGWQFSEHGRASTYYTFERTRYEQDGSGGGGDWLGRDTDTAHDLGITFDLVLIPDELEASLGWEYHRGKGESRSNGVGSDFPSIESDLQVLSLLFDYRIRSNLRTRFGYRYERFSQDDWHFDRIGLIPPAGTTNDVLMSNGVDDYDAHLFLATLIFEF